MSQWFWIFLYMVLGFGTGMISNKLGHGLKNPKRWILLISTMLILMVVENLVKYHAS
jgi:hypothetical protein